MTTSGGSRSRNLHADTVARISDLLKSGEAAGQRLAEERLNRLETLCKELKSVSSELLEDARKAPAKPGETELFGNYLIPLCFTFFVLMLLIFRINDAYFSPKDLHRVWLLSAPALASLGLGACLFRMFRVGALEIAIIPASLGIFMVAMQLSPRVAGADHVSLKLHLSISFLCVLVTVSGAALSWLLPGGRRSGRDLFELRNFMRRYYSTEGLRKELLPGTLFWNGGMLMNLAAIATVVLK